MSTNTAARCENPDNLSIVTKDSSHGTATTGFSCCTEGNKVKVGGTEHTVTAATFESWLTKVKHFINGDAGDGGVKGMLGYVPYIKITRSHPSISTTTSSDIPNTAQRELKWCVVLEDVVNHKHFVHEFPTANTAALEASSNTYKASVIAEFKKILEDITQEGTSFPLVYSPYGNPLKYITSYLQGRRYKNKN